MSGVKVLSLKSGRIPRPIMSEKRLDSKLDSYANAARSAPCARCYYERHCASGWSCASFRRWEKGYKPRVGEERIPDERYKYVLRN